jgi:hypothetical protein
MMLKAFNRLDWTRDSESPAMVKRRGWLFVKPIKEQTLF